MSLGQNCCLTKLLDFKLAQTQNPRIAYCWYHAQRHSEMKSLCETKGEKTNLLFAQHEAMPILYSVSYREQPWRHWAYQRINVTSHNKRYLMSIFENMRLSKRQLNKLSKDIKLLRIEVLLLKIWEKDWLYFVLFSLFFTIYFAQYLKTSLADIRYLLLWCVTYMQHWKCSPI